MFDVWGALILWGSSLRLKVGPQGWALQSHCDFVTVFPVLASSHDINGHFMAPAVF